MIILTIHVFSPVNRKASVSQNDIFCSTCILSWWALIHLEDLSLSCWTLVFCSHSRKNILTRCFCSFSLRGWEWLPCIWEFNLVRRQPQTQTANAPHESGYHSLFQGYLGSAELVRSWTAKRPLLKRSDHLHKHLHFYAY